jgi:hypothetical protein
LGREALPLVLLVQLASQLHQPALGLLWVGMAQHLLLLQQQQQQQV